ncbi:hypothetical protein [Nonomuraea sp. NPDC049784]|uniref:hypothetical protein n=1 Tax=Nonomuraea sp. NPDC049784 TaxID=3154361 RepID=UPI0033E50BCE
MSPRRFFLREDVRLPGIVIAALAGCAAALLTSGSLSRQADSYVAAHRQVEAEVMENHSRGVPKGVVVDIAWTGLDGQRHTGTARLSLDHAADTRVWVWVDAHERITPAPNGRPEIVLGSMVTGTGTVLAVWLAILLGRRLVRGRTERSG